jgi:hypothetical protein
MQLIHAVSRPAGQMSIRATHGGKMTGLRSLLGAVEALEGDLPTDRHLVDERPETP